MVSKRKQNPNKRAVIAPLIFLVNLLIFIGYIVIYPFSLTYNFVQSAINKLVNKLSDIKEQLHTYNRKHVKATSKVIKKKLKRNGPDISAIIRSKKVVVLSSFRDVVNLLKTRLASINFKINLKSKKKVPKKQLVVVKTTKLIKIKPPKEKRKLLTGKPAIAFAFVLGIIFTFLFLVTPIYAYSWYKRLPKAELLAQQANNKSTKILDRKGRVLYEIYVDKKYDPVSLEKVPAHVVNSTLAIEDSSFYDHYGVRPISMLRAAKSTLFEDELQGASTITQQLIKNVLLTPERTVSRKVKEVVLALMVENNYSKDEILELYLNNIPYGGTAYGVQAASQKYFGKNVWDLDLAESSLLAGLPSAPSIYSPVQGDGTLAKERQKQVLNRMLELGYITKAEAEEAYKKELVFAPQIEYIRAPHFVEYVRQELYKKYGQRTVDFGGLTVTTTLDLDMQEKTQQIVSEEVASNAALNFTNGAAVVLDSRSAGILAYVGSVDYFSENDGKFDVVTAYRQPGSSIKPVTYVLALEQGHTAATIIDDSPITYQSYGQTYSPKNYDGKYHGKVTLRQALANSYNIPAVKLVNTVGVDNMVKLGKEMGLKNWVPGDGSYGLAVTLGGKEVRMIDLVNVYATFSRGGIYKEVTPFISIKDSYGFEVYNSSDNSERRVLKAESAYILSNILSDNGARSAAFGPRSQLVVSGHTVSVKTGTTNDIRDNWTIGYTPSYTTAVWVGNNNNTPLNPRLSSGLTGAAPIWNKIMTTVLKDTADEPFIVPDGIIVKTDKSCGRTEVFDKSSKIPSSLCPVKKSDNDDRDKSDKKDDKRNKED